MSAEKENEDDEGGESGDDGKSGGGPKFKPDETLFDPNAAIGDPDSESGKRDSVRANGDGRETFGDWELLQDGLLIYNKKRKKRLLLEQLDSPGKMMKVIVALGSQDGWSTDDLIKTMDRAAQRRFNKNLYQIVSMTHDNASIDWVSGRINQHNHQREMGSGR